LHIATARVWQPPGWSQLMEMAGLPSDQVTMVAVVRELGSLPGVLLAFAQAVAAPAIHKPSVRRTIDREIMLSPLHPVTDRFPQPYLATTGPYSVAATGHYRWETPMMGFARMRPPA
jgi:hypothetical protein